MRTSIGIVLLLVLSGQVRAQASVPAWKVAQISKVLQRVGAAYGFGILDLPKLVVYPKNKNSRHIAHLQMISTWTQQPNTSLYRNRLILDEALVDLCTLLDKQHGQSTGTSLAFVLSHEMAHFYHRHATFRSLADPKSGAMSERVSSEQERQADQTGLLFAYLAGYDPEPGIEALFKALYANYDLSNNLWGYPTLTDRQRNTKLHATEFRTYGYLLAVGHALYCREQFDEAARCFEYVFTRYPLKETLNNFGVCRLQQLIRARKKNAISYFAMPIEVDPQNRLLRLGERSGNVSTTDLDSWFKEADAAFERAIDLDATYQTASLNRALGALLTNNGFSALGTLVAMERQSGQPLPPNGWLVRGIAYTALEDWPKADQSFRKATRAYQAGYNRYVAQAIRQNKLATLRQPWQRLQARPSDRPLLGCQAHQLLLRELDAIPQVVTWPGTYLMELSNPRPFISVESARAGAATYLRVTLGKDSLFFELPH